MVRIPLTLDKWLCLLLAYLLVLIPTLAFHPLGSINLSRISISKLFINKVSRNEYDDVISLLRSAATTKNVERRLIVESIAKLEKQNLKTIDPKSIEGKWEVIFTSIPGGADKGFVLGGFFDGYFAIREVCDFYGFSLKSSLGGFIGPSKVSSKVPLVVEYENREFKLGPIGVEVPPIVRSYRFIHVDQTLAIARTSSGGGTILRRLE